MLRGGAMSERYSIKEVFATLQGEGTNAGMPALFIRFGGCNLWNGRAKDREAWAERRGVDCPRWCDTDFFGGQPTPLGALLIKAKAEARPYLGRGCPLVVLTGGEPLLQVDDELVGALLDMFPNALVAIETNGTQSVAHLDDFRDATWVTCSPKCAPDALKLERADEVKVVWPCEHSPDEYARALGVSVHRFIQPRARISGDGVGRSLLDVDNTNSAISFVMKNAGWRLSVQTHKVVGIR